MFYVEEQPHGPARYLRRFNMLNLRGQYSSSSHSGRIIFQEFNDVVRGRVLYLRMILAS